MDESVLIGASTYLHAAAIADVNSCDVVELLVVLGTPVGRRSQERARRKCTARLLWELYVTYSVEQVIFETRTESDNRKDRAMVDAVAGAAGSALRGHASFELGPNLRPVEIDVT